MYVCVCVCVLINVLPVTNVTTEFVNVYTASAR